MKKKNHDDYVGYTIEAQNSTFKMHNKPWFSITVIIIVFAYDIEHVKGW